MHQNLVLHSGAAFGALRFHGLGSDRMYNSQRLCENRAFRHLGGA